MLFFDLQICSVGINIQTPTPRPHEKEVPTMNKKMYTLQLTLLLTLLWIILFERFTPIIVISGLGISYLTIWFSEKFLMEATFYELFPFNIFKLARYAIFLIIEIYMSGFSIIPVILTGQAKPAVVEIHTELESNILLVILSNSITLTPGTITLDIQGHRLLVLWLNPKTMQPTMAGIHIKGKIEQRLKEGI